ncbi:MAG: SDR family NAD(P)-dependent oxidoreductase, partial [Thauera sp.]
MNGISLVGRRVLVTQAEDFMGPALCAAFAAAGAELIADRSAPRQPGSGRAVIESAGHIDALVLNLAIPAPSTPAHQVSDDEWEAAFAALVHPMREMVAAVLPQMIERKAGKIVLMGSASALRGMARRSSYAACSSRRGERRRRAARRLMCTTRVWWAATATSTGARTRGVWRCA